MSEERLLRESRLLVAPPAMVYEAIKAYGESVDSNPFSGTHDDDLERNLLERNDQLIDLALARSCCDQGVWKALYQKSKRGGAGLEARYLAGLRLACLSNHNASDGVLSKFPFLEEAELRQLLREHQQWQDLRALFKNPNLSVNLWVELYKGSGPFADLDEQRRQNLIYISADNPRLIDDQSNEHGPISGTWICATVSSGCCKMRR